MAEEGRYVCPECQLGLLRQRRVSYFTMDGGQLISVPDFPAWVCDVCGRREYDAAAVAELRLMLESTRQPRRRAKRPRPEAEATGHSDRAARRRPG
ncbi:MAG: YgiT-type zinc finger protein [Chloroflexota bacterium]